MSVNSNTKQINCGRVKASRWREFSSRSAVLLSLFAIIAVLSSCNREETPVPAETTECTFKIDIPQNQPGTRNTAEEKKINSIEFFVFNTAGVKELHQTSASSYWNSAEGAMRMKLTTGAKQIYAIANWNLAGNAEMPKLADVANLAALKEIVRTHTNVTPSNPPVMVGVFNKTLVGGEGPIAIELIRQIARVEVMIYKGGASPGDMNLTIEGLKIVSMPKQTYLVERSPFAVASAEVWSQPAYTTTNVTVTAITEAAAQLIPQKLYVPESTAALKTELVIKAKYFNDVVYYHVPLNSTLAAKFEVRRNKNYVHYIVISGKGDSSYPATRSGLGEGSANVTVTDVSVTNF